MSAPDPRLIRRRLSESSDQELVKIAEGRSMDYHRSAVAVAQEMLAERGIPHSPMAIRDLERDQEEHYAKIDALEDASFKRTHSWHLMILGVGSMVGVQFDFLQPFESWGVLIGLVLFCVGAYGWASSDPGSGESSDAGAATKSKSPDLREGRPTPTLLQASDFDPGDIGELVWDTKEVSECLEVFQDGRTVRWAPDWKIRSGSKLKPMWLGALTRAHLHSGRYRWTYRVQGVGERQIALGAMLLWNIGPDWGFFGYLGASPTAWSYDPTTGDVVTATESIHGGLGTFDDDGGDVTVEALLPRTKEGSLQFTVGGIESPPVSLPKGTVLVPAASLMSETQSVTLSDLEIGEA